MLNPMDCSGDRTHGVALQAHQQQMQHAQERRGSLSLCRIQLESSRTEAYAPLVGCLMSICVSRVIRGW